MIGCVLFLLGCVPGQYTEGITELASDGDAIFAWQCNPVTGNLPEYLLPEVPAQLRFFGAFVYKARFASADGGLTWGPVYYFYARQCNETPQSFSQATPEGEFRLELGQGISFDGLAHGSIDTSFLSDPLFRMLTADQYEGRSGTRANYTATVVGGPYDAVVDPLSGNLVVAMGLQGLLVRTPGGEWNWVGVGNFQKVSDASSERIGLLKNIGVLAQAVFIGIIAVLWPLVARRTWITHDNQPQVVRVFAPALLVLALVSLIWSFQWAGFGTFLRFNNGLFVIDVTVLLAVSYFSVDFAWPGPEARIWKKRLVIGAVIAASAAALVVVLILSLWARSTIDSLANAKWLAALAVAPVSLAYLWWIGSRLDRLPAPEPSTVPMDRD
jgi:hypothetical protein